MRINLKYIVSGLVLSAVVAGVTLHGQVFSEAPPPVDWLATQPTVEKVFDYPGWPEPSDPYGNRDCTKTSIQVYRGVGVTQAETHCLVPVAMGQMGFNGGVVQPVGYDKAYRVNGYPGSGNATFIPVPHHASAVQMAGYSTGVGVSLGLYKNFYSQLRFNYENAVPNYKVAGQPEEYFRFDDGTWMRFNHAAIAFSNSGQFLVADTVTNGFMKADMNTLAKRPVATSIPRTSSGSTIAAAPAIDDTGRYVAIAYGAPGGWGDPYMKIVDTLGCSGGFNSSPNPPATFNCRTVNLRPQIAAVIPNLLEITNVRFVNERMISFMASSDSSSGRKYARYVMVAGGQKRSLVEYLALGDSYISGEGAYSYRSGTDTQRNRCHQSTLSYPYLLSASKNSFASVACSGARSKHIEKQGNDGAYQVYDDAPSVGEVQSALTTHTPGITDQLSFILQDNPDAVTLSIGGNDIGFSHIISKCVHPLQRTADSTCYATYEDRVELVNLINGQMMKWNQLYKNLRDNGAQGRRLYVVGYPQVAKVGGDCGLNVMLNADELVFARDLIAYLNSVIKKAADAAGVVYVDTQQAFDGHRLCEGNGANNAINGFTIGRTTWGDFGFAESYHPNAIGHEKLAAVVADQTDDLTKPMPEPTSLQPITSVDQNIPLLKDAPRSNRTVRKTQPLGQDVAIVSKGVTVPVTISQASFFTKANSTYQISLHSNPIALGTTTSDGQGNVSANPVIPAEAEPGFHTLHVYGDDIFGNQIDLHRTVYVADSDNDYDGDNVANDVDSCALASQSGVDKDVDNIDDVCDPSVGPPPTIPPNEEGIIWRDDTVLELTINATANSGQ